MDSDFQALIELFVSLGGVADNVRLSKGALGRGIFPIDPSLKSKILTPVNLLINANHVGIRQNEIYVTNHNQLSAKEKNFIELNYNYAWNNGGNSPAAEFVKYVSMIPESVKSQLIGCGFIDRDLLNQCLDENSIFKRFIAERFVSFEGTRVLASIWDLVNHSSFTLPFRASNYGVETPPISPGSEEILFKYSGQNSPLNMWKKYGFACDCIVAYSIPFDIHMGNQTFIRCFGQLDLGPKEKINFSINDNIISIKSLPVGCLSAALPQENFKSIMSSFGISLDVVNRLFFQIRELNLKARRDLIGSLQNPGPGASAELYKALQYEVKLIDSALIP